MGQTKVTIEETPVFAKELGIDPVLSMQIAMREYLPDVWKALEQTFGKSLTAREEKFLLLLREADPDAEIVIDTTLQTKITDLLRERQATA